MIKVFAFLGNYGNDYIGTRHNAGFFCAENLTLTKNLVWKKKFDGEYGKLNSPKTNETLHFLKPHTFMNNSGRSIIQLMQFFKIEANELLVFHDELELEIGTISFKWSGGLGGHNGLRSIKANLGTADFWRLRIGIDRPENKNANIADYVLSRFSNSQLNDINSQLYKLDSLMEEILKCKMDGELKALIPKWSKVKKDFN